MFCGIAGLTAWSAVSAEQSPGPSQRAEPVAAPGISAPGGALAARIANARKALAASVAARKAPYPPSPVIHEVRWAPAETIVRKARGSDNWPLTWADDDALYTAYGDGNGFEPFLKAKLSLGLARIQGTPLDFQGINLRSDDAEQRGEGRMGKKASGMLMVDGRLYMLVRNAGNSELAWSDDHARTWKQAAWRFEESFGCPTFLNFGRNYAGARDQYVYVYSHDADTAYAPSDRAVLARVPKDRVTDRASYEFFTKSDASGSAVWSKEIRGRGAVLSNPGLCYRMTVAYNPALKRYMLAQILYSEESRFAGGLGIYDAPEPWGPWTTVYFSPLWDVGPGETASIPTKWISADGKSFHLVFSGDDCFSVRRADVVLAEPPASGRQSSSPRAITITGAAGPSPEAGGDAEQASARQEAAVLLDDDFSGLEAGMFSAAVGAHTEYHFLPEAAPRGGWNVACFASGAAPQRAWQVKQEGGRRVMAQTFDNDKQYTHPLVVAGDPLWRDYRLAVRFAPESNRGASGLVFRYHNNRCYYFLGFQGNRVVLKRVHDETAFHQPDERVLAAQGCDWKPGHEYLASLAVEGRSIRAEIADATGSATRAEPIAVLRAEDDTYLGGRVGLLADSPTRFYHVKVTTSPAERQRFDEALAVQVRELESLRAANPRPVVWKKINTEGFGVGRNLRFGDLDGDGQADVLIGQVLHHGPSDQYSELSCLTAMTFDGKILWRIGEPDPEKYHLTNDVGFQIHDLDRDGRNEVVYCMNSEIVVVDGSTGRVKYKTPTPASKPPANRYPRILGDSLFFCDLRGRGHAQDVIIKDRYWHLWALSDRLEPLWEGECRTGHYPFAADVDGDGHDELAIGYALFDHDGKLLWNLENEIEDHADGVAIVDFQEGPGSKPRVFYAASDAGAVYVDLAGKIIRRHWIGHVQNPAIADFRPDMPGLEMVSINFWGNQGILHFYNAEGEIYHDCEPNPFGSMCLPVNWTGQPGELFVHNPNIRWGGMYDGWGRCVVTFPDDGHPDMCNAVLDLAGDCRDEVVVWDPKQIWVYTQSDNPKPGRLYRPKRNPLYNYSNYQATVSLPGWTKE